MGFRLSRTYLLCLLLPTLAAAPPPTLFREVPAAESGIHWKHENGESAQRYLPETGGGGVALLDYDQDGWLDILFINSGTSSFYKPPAPLAHALYHNNHDGSYTDVTKQAGLTADLFGMGAAVGDYDGDGYPDILITGVARCVLYHNNQDGTFSDVTASSGIAASPWSTSALWFDFDNDGKLDLFVANFADYSDNKVCSLGESYGEKKAGMAQDHAYYCDPQVLKAAPSRLFRNLGNGKFEDVSERTGIAARPGKAWGVVATDVNGDGYLDLFVANDTMPNYLWLNRKGERFEEAGIEAGVAYSSEGRPRSGMGVDAGDFDRDGLPDLMVANVDAQMTSLYRNDGNEMFTDIRAKTGVGAVTLMMSGWGMRLFDYDNDGWLDMVLANGHFDPYVNERNGGITFRQPIFLLRNIAGQKTENVSAQAGPAFSQKYSARGLAVGDLNNDGYPDIVFVENGGPPHLLMNTAGAGNNWLGIELKAKAANPAASGAILRWSIGGKVFRKVRGAGGSYIASQDPREVMGAGKSQVDWIEVQWPAPSHAVDRITKPAMNRYLVIREGQTKKPTP
ncbi:MAG: CRTAC1 family protein [Acidobacteria bacterium]|nr:CRTAC1 family protein [Acidobacteriota bacterium]